MIHFIERIADQSTRPDLALGAGSWLAWRERLARARADEAGMTTETVIITAGLAAAAVAIVVAISAYVRGVISRLP